MVTRLKYIFTHDIQMVNDLTSGVPEKMTVSSLKCSCLYLNSYTRVHVVELDMKTLPP